jgi:hypothetical protein
MIEVMKRISGTLAILPLARAIQTERGEWHEPARALSAGAGVNIVFIGVQNGPLPPANAPFRAFIAEQKFSNLSWHSALRQKVYLRTRA